MLDAVAFPDFLPQKEFEGLLQGVKNIMVGERVHIPGHKKGATVSYKTLQEIAPELVAFYWSDQLLKVISLHAGEEVAPTPMHDQSSCSILIYDQPGDRISWHYDWNFYDGRHFTALLTFINQNAANTGTSSAQLLVRSPQGQRTIATPPNTLVLFEGAFVRHCVEPLGPGETRIVLSMTFSTSPNSSPLKGALRRFKDIAYFGPRALWT